MSSLSWKVANMVMLMMMMMMMTTMTVTMTMTTIVMAMSMAMKASKSCHLLLIEHLCARICQPSMNRTSMEAYGKKPCWHCLLELCLKNLKNWALSFGAPPKESKGVSDVSVYI